MAIETAFQKLLAISLNKHYPYWYDKVPWDLPYSISYVKKWVYEGYRVPHSSLDKLLQASKLSQLEKSRILLAYSAIQIKHPIRSSTNYQLRPKATVSDNFMETYHDLIKNSTWDEVIRLNNELIQEAYYQINEYNNWSLLSAIVYAKSTIYRKRGNFGDFDSLMNDIKDSILESDILRIVSHLSMGWYLLDLGTNDLNKSLLNEANDFLYTAKNLLHQQEKSQDVDYLLLQTINGLGWLNQRQGKYYEAQRYFHDGISLTGKTQLLSKPIKREFRGRFRGSLSWSQFQTGKIQESARLLLTIDVSGVIKEKSSLAMFALDSAIVLACLGDYELAGSFGQKGEELVHELKLNVDYLPMWEQWKDMCKKHKLVIENDY